tara:strand:+ start:88263 stop:89063 length:801 start_codon:yes stop_codon:yes gene_type:complete
MKLRLSKMPIHLSFCILLAFAFLISCKESQPKTNKSEINDKQTATVLYKTENLIIEKLSDHVYMHTSFLNTDDFGRVACNGMLLIDKNEAVVFDTPTTNESSKELITYINEQLNAKITTIIPTHFHDDCVGGLEAFLEKDIPSQASSKTIGLLKKNAYPYADQIRSFDTSFTMKIGESNFLAQYFGEGHTEDNIVAYYPKDQALFGGCLLKATDASKGYLGDANPEQWSETVRLIKSSYPDLKIVIPGHGKWGNTALLDYTIKLFE